MRTSVAMEEVSDSIQVNLVKRLRSLCYNDFIHTYRTLNARVLLGVDWCRLFSVTMIGRRVNSVEALGNQTFPPR